MVSSRSSFSRERLIPMLQVWIHESRTCDHWLVWQLPAKILGFFFKPLLETLEYLWGNKDFEFIWLADGVLVHWCGRKCIKLSSRVYLPVIFVN